MHTPRYSPSLITVPYCFHYSQLEQRRKKAALLYLFIEHWKIHETCGGGEGSEMTNSDRSKTFADKCVSKPSASVFCECRLETASHREAYCLSSRCVITLHIHLSSSPPTPAVFPGMPSKQIRPGIDFWLRIRIFLCPATSSNLANTNLTSNNRHCGAACQFRCAPLHLGPLWLRLPRSPPLSASLARSFLHAGLPFHEDYITAHFISHTCIHTQFNLRSSFYFQTLFGGCL